MFETLIQYSPYCLLSLLSNVLSIYEVRVEDRDAPSPAPESNILLVYFTVFDNASPSTFDASITALSPPTSSKCFPRWPSFHYYEIEVRA